MIIIIIINIIRIIILPTQWILHISGCEFDNCVVWHNVFDSQQIDLFRLASQNVNGVFGVGCTSQFKRLFVIVEFIRQRKWSEQQHQSININKNAKSAHQFSMSRASIRTRTNASFFHIASIEQKLQTNVIVQIGCVVNRSPAQIVVNVGFRAVLQQKLCTNNRINKHSLVKLNFFWFIFNTKILLDWFFVGQWKKWN